MVVCLLPHLSWVSHSKTYIFGHNSLIIGLNTFITNHKFIHNINFVRCINRDYICLCMSIFSCGSFGEPCVLGKREQSSIVSVNKDGIFAVRSRKRSNCFHGNGVFLGPSWWIFSRCFLHHFPYLSSQRRHRILG